MSEAEITRAITFTVNGAVTDMHVEERFSLADMLRHCLALTGTHLGCEHGVCGACTVLVDGEAIRSCLMLAVQVDGSDVTTIEGLADEDGRLTACNRPLATITGCNVGFARQAF